MTLTTAQKTDIDKLWTEFWTGGITNPLTVIEQISFLMFSRLLDVMETTGERKAERTKKPFAGRFRGKSDPRRWKNFKQLPATASDSDAKRGLKGMLQVVRDEVFPHFRKLNGGTTFGEYMQDAQLMIQKPNLLVQAVNMVDALPITEGDAKGDLYEYLLSKLTTAGINGQFRTPRHIIRFMVELLEPKPTESVGDPACGTAGFLVGVMQYLLETHTSPKGRMKGENGETIYTGDLLEPYRAHIQSGMFHGFDFDATMLRIASMNLMLHGVDSPDIHYQDTLSNSFPEKFPDQAANGFDVILANPPFKGSLDEGDVHPTLTQAVKTKKTELLFLALILRMLKRGGRSATIVPDGVLFGSSKAHVALREMLVKENQLEGVFSLPSGVFKPYAGVSTAILVFRKHGKTDNVFFYDVQADGFSLDDKRTEASKDHGPFGPLKGNDLYDALERWRKQSAKKNTDRAAKHFMVPRSEIEEKDFDLSINRYKEAKHEEVSFEPPKKILAKLKGLEEGIASDLTELEGLL
jgi:type I restriction enzyme M protein